MSNQFDGLPPLPEPKHRGPDGTGSYFDSYTADQVREAQRAAVLAEREACSKLAYDCVYQIPYDGGNGYQCIEVHTPKQAGRAIAAAIRARA